MQANTLSLEDREEISKKSIAEKVAAPDYWRNNLSILICVVKPEHGQSQVKDVPSTEGMALSLTTSELMAARI